MPLVSKSTPFTHTKKEFLIVGQYESVLYDIRHKVYCQLKVSFAFKGALLGQVNFTSSPLFTHLAKFDLLSDRVWGGGGQGNAKNNFHCPSPSPLLAFAIAHPFRKIPFSPLPSTAVKIKDSGHTFHKENIEP